MMTKALLATAVTALVVGFAALAPGLHQTSVATGAVTVSAGATHACAVTAAGGVQCWGNNSEGQLGDGTTDDGLTLVDVCADATCSTSLTGIVAISAGRHTCAVTTGGGVKCWGRNTYGQLGDGTTVDRLTPVDVLGLTGVDAIAAGAFHTCAVTTGGGVKCWGRNTYGQLGDGQACGGSCSTAVDVVGLGANVAGVAVGFVHTCAVTTDGSVECWGNNFHGQLGIGGSLDTFQTTPINVFQLANDVVAVATGDWHTCALTTAGGVKCWGEDSGGQLGDGKCCINRTAPVDVLGLSSGVAQIALGGYHTCAVTTGGGVKCWGWNVYGALGDGQACGDICTTPVDVVGLTSGVASVAGGGAFSCALTTAGGLKCWGFNMDGRVGDGRACGGICTTPVDVAGLGPKQTLTHSPTPTQTLTPTITPTPTITLTPTITPTPTVTPEKQPEPGDTDGDGCSDQRENGPDETLGGQRDYVNPWDFYDVSTPKDGVVDLSNDIFGVILHFSPAGLPPYDVYFDRGPSAGPNVWNLTAPDGVIDLGNDILGVIFQYGHDCG